MGIPLNPVTFTIFHWVFSSVEEFAGPTPRLKKRKNLTFESSEAWEIREFEAQGGGNGACGEGGIMAAVKA